MKMRTCISATMLATIVFASHCHAAEGDDSTDHFAKTYSGFCMKHINNPEALRTQLIASKVPKLPPEQATHFLSGHEGDAWPVPYQGRLGNLVLALPAGKNVCALYMRKANQADVERAFIKPVGQAPAPLVVEKRTDKHADTPGNGETHTISYAWSVPQAKRKMVFTLTTASSDKAQLHVLASAAMVTE
ncbi:MULTISPECIES: hypothetical protein [unclassified Massilia]|uniref:NMCC_0638 family (lipo)protein n=1 Tax=unclassified Massilia TaxID=2609279 RepID=UPI001780E54D|nr:MULTISPECIES: hypothetical protein [unclassified Massilia]MBD8531084.1 hypothetical protein [Massilia sp. CFBP 13647]MBD8674784.1 hypothetical protein [Massilia sp. CFBP 13721]